jgi:hypothetical protein
MTTTMIDDCDDESATSTFSSATATAFTTIPTTITTTHL